MTLDSVAGRIADRVTGLRPGFVAAAGGADTGIPPAAAACLARIKDVVRLGSARELLAPLRENQD